MVTAGGYRWRVGVCFSCLKIVKGGGRERRGRGGGRRGGEGEKLQRELEAFVEETGIDELMIASHIYDKTAKLKSFLIVSEVMNSQILSPI